MLLLFTPTLLLLLPFVVVELLTRVEVLLLPWRKLLLPLPLLLPEMVDNEPFTRVVFSLPVFNELFVVLTFTLDSLYELPVLTPVDTVPRELSRPPSTLP